MQRLSPPSPLQFLSLKMGVAVVTNFDAQPILAMKWRGGCAHPPLHFIAGLSNDEILNIFLFEFCKVA